MKKFSKVCSFEGATKFIIFLAPVLAILLVFREVIFQSKVFSHLDFLLTYSPYFNFLSSSTELISKSILSGFPVYVSISSTWFNPINQALLSFMDAFDVLRFLDVTYMILAYVFSYLFIRRLGVSHFSSIFGATTFIFAGQVMLWSETIIITNYYFLMPLSLYLVDHIVDSKVLKRVFLCILLGLVLGYGWLSGHVQFLVYLYVLTFSFWLYLVYKRSLNGSIFRVLFLEFGLFVLVVLISLIEGWPQIKAVLDFLPMTARSEGVSLSQATAYAYGPHHLIYYFLPWFKFPYISLSQSFQNYVGILQLFVFAMTFANWRHLKKTPYFNFFFWTLVSCFTLSVQYSPLAFILHQLPFFDSFRETFRVMFIGDFAFGVVVAMTLDALWRNREELYPKIERMTLWIKRGFLWVFLPLITLFSFVNILFFEKIETFLGDYFINNLYSETTGGFPIEHYQKIINTYLNQSLDQFYIFNYSIIILISAGIASYFLIRNIKKLSFVIFTSLAVFIAVSNFSLVYVHRIVGVPKSEIINAPKTAEFIKSLESSTPFRIFSPLMSETMYNESTRCGFRDLGNWDVSNEEFALRRELIEPDLHILYGLESADGYEPYAPVRVSEMIGFVGSRFAVTSDHVLSGENISFEEKTKKIVDRKNIYRAMNVKYILTTYKVTDGDFIQVYFDELGECKTPIYIYELRNPYPRYFITDRVVSIPQNTKFLEQAEVILKSENPVVVVESGETIGTYKSTFVKEIQPTKVGDIKEFFIDTPIDVQFLIGDTWLPNWEAYLDGERVVPERANYIYMSLPLSSGQHNVRLEYKK
ncbi:MAG: hypothetical protein V4690_03380 [Patescibacteria group bacterium]